MPDSSAISGPLLAVIAFVVYTGGMAIGWKLSPYDYEADGAKLVRSIVPVLVVLVALMMGLIWWSGIDVMGDRVVVSPWLWLGLMPPLVGIAGMALGAFRDRLERPDWPLFAATMLGTALVGMGEESAFRALAYNGLAQEFSVPVAVALSSVLFGFLHSVNVIAGLTPAKAAKQVIFTAVLGTLLAWIYVLSGRNLVLVMAWHFFYDFALIGTPVLTGKPNSLGAIGALVGMAAMVVLWIVGLNAF